MGVLRAPESSLAQHLIGLEEECRGDGDPKGLHERDIHISVQQMHCDRMAQRMQTPLGLRDLRPLAILLPPVPVQPAFQEGYRG
jgi:hypothetical protein